MLDLKELNREGLIPGPDEGREAFFLRVERFRKMRESSSIPLKDWEGAFAITVPVYDIRPLFVSAYYEDKNLPFWQAAATWIEGDYPSIQLKTALKKGHFLGIYKREEILAHEAVHAARAAFSEPKFEEILAYRTSKNPLRRFLGPLFQYSYESYVFIFLLVLTLALDMVHVFYDLPSSILFLKFLPFLALLAGLLRLTKNKRTFFKCRQKLANLTPHPDHIMLRLSDKEISLFAKMPENSIREYIDKECLPAIFSITWEELCRLAIPRLSEHWETIYGQAGRYWEGQNKEWDVLSESIDGMHFLIGEAKWTEKKPSANWIYKTIQELKSKGIPPIKRHPRAKLQYVLFIPEKPKHLELPPDVKIIEAKDVIEALI